MKIPPATIGIVKKLVFVAALVPAAMLVYGAFTGNLTANPVEYLENETGDWAITLLIVSLAITPLRRLTGWNDIIRLRRLLGLLAFFYAFLHVLIWFALVSFFDIPTMVADITKRPFIMVGSGPRQVGASSTSRSKAAGQSQAWESA